MEKIAKLTKNQANCFGIVLDDPSAAFEFAEKANLNFPVYLPADSPRFISHFRIKSNMAHSILYHNKVLLSFLGDISGNQASALINKVKELEVI